MTVSEAQDLLRQFGNSIDFNDAFVIVAGRGLDLNVHPVHDGGWECYLIGAGGATDATADTPLAAVREALRNHYLGG